jgi:hypothetical protein
MSLRVGCLNQGGDAGKAHVSLTVGAARRRLSSQLVKEKLA